jgi:small subunit ribosomal protein S21
MLVIEIKNNGGIQKALKTLKSKVIKTKQQKLLTERKEYTKKSVKERSKRLKAIYVQKKKNN